MQPTAFAWLENASDLVPPHSTLVRSKRLEESFPASQREVGRNGVPAPIRNGNSFYRGPFSFKRSSLRWVHVLPAFCGAWPVLQALGAGLADERRCCQQSALDRCMCWIDACAGTSSRSD